MKKQLSDELYGILNRPRFLTYRIQQINAQIMNLESCLYPGAIRYDREKVDSSPSDKMPQIVAEIVDLEKERERLEKEVGVSKDTLIRFCESNLSEELDRTVIIMHYIGKQTFEQIGVALSYSKGWVWHTYDRAIDILEEALMKKETK